jgi:hypothetical protein
MTPTPDETLKRLQDFKATSQSKPASAVASVKKDCRRLDVPAYCSHFKREIVKTKDAPGGGTMYCLKHCVFDENHSPNESSIIQGTNGKLSYQCFHASCKAHKWEEARYQISGEENLDEWMVGVKGTGEKQADALVRIGKTAELFRAPDDSKWARFQVDGHFENWPIRSKGYRHWIVSKFFQEEGTAPAPTASQSAIDVLEAEAQFGPEATTREVFTRVGWQDGVIYLDLADKEWRAIRISAQGWSLVNEVPVCFRRTNGMLPLTEPFTGGNLRLLDDILNFGGEENRIRILSWLLGCLNPFGPYSILDLISEQGSGKSVMARILRMVVDPNKADIRALPKSLEDLAIAGQNSWILSFDNLSRISDIFSDALCRMSTGSGVATRSLYTNDEEKIFWAKRPIMLNGIEEFAGRQDLLERSQIANLPAIPPNKRKTERAIFAAFEKVRPAFLGALLDAAVLALKNLSSVILSESPRMADFGEWTAAAAPALGTSNKEVVELMLETQKEALLSGLDAPLPQTVLRLLKAQAGNYKGQLSDLLIELNKLAPGNVTKQKSWPTNEQVLGNALMRIAPALREAGVDFQKLKKTNKGRPVTLKYVCFGLNGDGTSVNMDKNAEATTECRHQISTQNHEISDQLNQKSDDGDDAAGDLSPSFHFQEEKEGEREKAPAIPSPPSPRHLPNLLEGEL